MATLPFLRIPPFPGHRAEALAQPAEESFGKGEDAARLLALLREARVGGGFWGAQPALPMARDLLLAPDSQAQAHRLVEEAAAEGLASRAVLIGPYASSHGIPVYARRCDPWHLAAQAHEVRGGANRELVLVSAICGTPLQVIGAGRFASLARGNLLDCIADELVYNWRWRDPFTGEVIEPSRAIALLADWRRQIDANRTVAAVFGVAHWKRVTMDALLWDGSGPVRHAAPRSTAVNRLKGGDHVLAWKARTASWLPGKLESRGVQVGEIEDGMIRSTGLGANCVPPLSVIFDMAGAHFDPSQTSGLEALLQSGEIAPADVARAVALRERLVHAGISKYGQDNRKIERPSDSSRRVLVTGQVEDDRSMLTGGAGCSNLELVRQARMIEPDAWLIYKPHPDVEAGHRKGMIPDDEVLLHANEIERDAPITALIDSVDAVHVITSLSGFEALMRGKAVTTHGVPFYAGWGLTRDLGPVPARRSRKRSLDELVAATLLLYPRYVDPVTRLPCPAEVLVERMAAGQAKVTSPLVRLREAQGRLNLALRRFRRS